MAVPTPPLPWDGGADRGGPLLVEYPQGGIGMRLWSVAAVFAGVVVGTGCVDDAGSCTVGESAPCACTNGLNGAQVCQDDHTFSECICDSADAGPVVDAALVDSQLSRDGAPVVCTGAVVLLSAADVADVSHCEVIIGDLLVESDVGPDSVTLPHLRRVSGNVRVQNGANVVRVVMPSLSAVGESVYITDLPMIGEVDLGGLESVGAFLSIGSLPLLLQLDVESLSTVGENLSLMQLGALTAVDLPELDSLRRFTVANNPILASVTANALAYVDLGINVNMNPELVSFSVGSLTTVPMLAVTNNTKLSTLGGFSSVVNVTSDLNIAGNSMLQTLGWTTLQTVGGRLFVLDNAMLNSLADFSMLSAVEGTELTITGNPQLNYLGLDSLASLAGDLYVENNIALPTCWASALVTQLLGNGWTGTAFLVGNDDDGVCQ